MALGSRDTRRLAMAIAASACALLPLFPSTAVGTANDLERYEGTWAYADGDEGLRRIEVGIERSVQGLPFFVVPVARDVVRGRIAHSRELRLEVEGSLFRFRTERWGPVSSRVDGPAVRIVGPEGSRLELSQRLGPSGHVVQRFAHVDGARENELALSGDSAWLWMSVRIHSPRLPDECRYRLRYRRVEAAPR
jgi:hypothetical protein